MLNKKKLHSIIFEANTPSGRWFDVILLIAILLSVSVVMLESVPSLAKSYGNLFKVLEWVFTIFFTIEYILRLYCVKKPIKYATSFFGVVDFLSTIPSYLQILFAGSHYFVIIRSLRLLRVFRVLKLVNFTREGNIILIALRRSFYKISVFLAFILMLVLILGSLMYIVEDASAGFTSIPRSVYWAIVTLTTVGYGDITPQTELGQLIAAMVMLLGYAIIAVPTGIVSADLIRNDMGRSTSCCPSCTQEGHADDAEYCKYCGSHLDYSE